MITKKEYLKAKQIIAEYENQSKLKPISKDGDRIKIRDAVMTTKGCRFKGTFTGNVVGFTSWGGYPAVKLKKHSDGKIATCLAKNLIHI